MNDFEINIGSVPYREKLIACIFYKKACWAEISQEDKEMTIRFYPHPEKESWDFAIEDSLQIIEEAKQKLENLHYRKY